MPKVNTKLVSWDEIVNWTYSLSKKIEESGWRPDIVVSIARGGYIPARLVCDFLDINDLVSIQVLHWGKAAEITATAHVRYGFQADLKGKKVLIVDDICDTGDSIIVAKEYIEKNYSPGEIKVAVMQWISSVAKIKPDFYVDEVKEWVWYQYPWTRAEDTTNFIEKILVEYSKSGRNELTLKELIETFREWYGIDVGDRYYKLAIDKLARQGKIRIVGEEKIIVQQR
ncbi:MAG: phosphoribosyltransferase [Infirmifilum sp.]|uniref:Phosphoribosyl transferase n=1 Tax=Infirmifilum uzonense TaxID=1550241 RepID=A0A0F7FJB3_9CREN|nr:phosphoribosyltransferase [Infirmifilum uzonense]AKG38969.1 phosphoribosyl transferase [Infirmifilum uzonense]